MADIDSVETWTPFPGLWVRANRDLSGKFFALEVWRLEDNVWRYLVIRDVDIFHSIGFLRPPGEHHE